MRLLLAGFGVAVLAVVGWLFGRAVQDSLEWRTIVALADKGLGPISSDEEREVEALLRKRYPREEPWGYPWAGLHFEGAGFAERIVLIHGGGSLWLPAISMIPISVLDENRRDRSSTWILPGDGSRIVGLRQVVAGAPSAWCFEMIVSAVQEEVDVRERHVYALLAEKPVLIRLEDGGGKLRANDYRSAYVRVGEVVPVRSPEELERSLDASDLADVLRTLLWLGGLHDLPTGGEPSGPDESEPSRVAHYEALNRPGLRARVLELRFHPHPWVAEAAAQVEISD